MARHRRSARRTDPAPRDGRQLLVDGHSRPVRSVVGDLLRPRPRLRHRGWSGGQRGPLHRDLEPRVHAERARGRHVEDRLRDPRSAAPAEHRHRHGGRAGGVPAAGCGQRLRNRPAAPRHRSGGGYRPAWVRAGKSRRRRPLPDHRRPHPYRGDHHRRRRQPRQRGSRLRAASSAASHHPGGQAARSRSAGDGRTDGHRARRDGPVVSGTRQRLRPDPAHRRRGGNRVQPHSGLGFAPVRRGSPQHEGIGSGQALRQ